MRWWGWARFCGDRAGADDFRVMIFEMTQDYAVIVPLMIANLVSLFLASRLQPEPIYEALAVQDGIHLPSAEARQRQGVGRVGRLMRPSGETLGSEMTVAEALERVRSSESKSWLITDSRGVIGVVNLSRWNGRRRKIP